MMLTAGAGPFGLSLLMHQPEVSIDIPWNGPCGISFVWQSSKMWAAQRFHLPAKLVPRGVLLRSWSSTRPQPKLDFVQNRW